MNGVLFQGFHWFLATNFPGSNGRNLWQFLAGEADHLRSIGITAVWMPPAYRGANRTGVGYDVYDHYNIGEFPAHKDSNVATRYGTQADLKAAVTALHGNGQNQSIGVYADIVLNHKTGGDESDGFWEAIRVEKHDRTLERWGAGWEEGKIEVKSYTKFQYPERGGRYSAFTWEAKHFDSVDTVTNIRQHNNNFTDSGSYIYRFLYNELGYEPHIKNFERWVDLEKGNFDFFTACDFDYGRPDVRAEMKAWGEWYIREFGFDGVRLDAVKHISAGYIREWLGHVRHHTGKNLFAVAEYIPQTLSTLHGYIEEVSTRGDYPQTVSLFDFPLFFKFRELSWQGDRYSLANLFGDTLVAEQPALAVTFVENHDYEFGRDPDSHVKDWFKPLAYAFILLRKDGYPCVFFPDYYGSVDHDVHKGYQIGKAYLQLLLKLRKQFALGEEQSFVQHTVAGWMRLGFVPGAKGAMAVVINTAYNRVQAIRMHTARPFTQFYHLATIRHTPGGYLVVRGAYEVYGNKEQGLWTDHNGWADFVADGGAVSIWLEAGTVLE